jgi:hypothetical protein
VKGSDIAAKTSGKLNLNTKIDPQADALFLTAIDYRGEEIWRWSFALPKENEVLKVAGNVPISSKTDSLLVVSAGNNSYAFSNKNGELKQVTVNGKTISFANGPRFVAARRADRSLDQFYNHDDEQAHAKERTYTEWADAAVFKGFDVKQIDNKLIVTANYKLGNLDKAQWTIAPDGTMTLDYSYNFSAVVDLMGVKFDYPEEKMLRKSWLGGIKSESSYRQAIHLLTTTQHVMKNGVNRMCVMLNGDSCQTLLSELKAELAEAVNR